MRAEDVERLAQQLLSGDMPVSEFVRQFAQPRSADLGTIMLDLDRQQRCGYPEVIFGEGKSVDQMEAAIEKLLLANQPVLVTRLDAGKADALRARIPAAVYNALARTLRLSGAAPDAAPLGRVVVVTAGSSDLAVAEEARETAAWMGAATDMVLDVGVAGPHRLPEQLHRLRDADAIVVVAGMEGALPSVVGGYVSCPVIAVPTSVGYGASFGGLAALLGMLNSCAANVAVVNIDAGFKGGYLAGLIARRSADKRAAPS